MHCCGNSHIQEKGKHDDVDEIMQNIKEKKKIINSLEHSSCGCKGGHG